VIPLNSKAARAKYKLSSPAMLTFDKPTNQPTTQYVSLSSLLPFAETSFEKLLILRLSIFLFYDRKRPLLCYMRPDVDMYRFIPLKRKSCMLVGVSTINALSATTVRVQMMSEN
jgi:hypothetical protein